jgi:tRNA threonylcarbamoyladenosine biosynthesis protein TsaB
VKESSEPTYILALESAIAEGSAALIAHGSAIAHTRVANGCSRAEKIISVVADLLDGAGLARTDLDLIAVSTGPGSYSGIRIGMSTAIGLANALNVPCAGVSVLQAMAHASNLQGAYIAAVPVGKNDVAWQKFGAPGPGSSNAAEMSSSESFIIELGKRPSITLFAHTDLLPRISDKLPAMTRLVDAGRGMAEFVGHFALLEGIGQPLRPIYLRNRDAAPRTRFL